MSRSYRSVRPKGDWVYCVEDILSLYHVCRNTLSNWVSAGLRPIDQKRPQLFRGTELKRFHDGRALNSPRSLTLGEFKCFSCRSRVVPALERLRYEGRPKGPGRVLGHCPDCGRDVFKILDATRWHMLRSGAESNTSPCCTDEFTGAFAACVGRTALAMPNWTSENDRILHDYQTYGRRYDEKTLTAHLSSIRHLEAFFGGRDFVTLSSNDIDRYRTALLALGTELSVSTIRHRASHLETFFHWLVSDHRRMNQRLPEYFRLPKSLSAQARQPKPPKIPTIDDFNKMFASMPSRTLVQRRDRAIVAATLLFCTRIGATASLRVESVDPETRKVFQNARLVRTKNGKTFDTNWFPVSAEAEAIVRNWIADVVAIGAYGEDALFLPDEWAEDPSRLTQRDRNPVQPWKTDRSVRKAFATGCAIAGLKYFSPHTTRHLLKALEGQFCRTPEERKAWSLNYGHTSAQTTEIHYGKITDERRDQIFGFLRLQDRESYEDMELLLAYHDKQLVPGSIEYKMAEEMDNERRSKRRETR